MLKKIDCIMIHVDDLAVATQYYVEVFGMRQNWSDETMVGLAFPETDAEIVLHTEIDIPARVEPHYLVEDVVSAVRHFEAHGCKILEAPFAIVIGKCAVVEDPFGTRLCILDMSKGARQ